MIVETLLSLFRNIRETKAAEKILSFLHEEQFPQLQFQAARFVSYYSEGPRIPDTPKESSWHPVCKRWTFFLFLFLFIQCVFHY